MEGNTVFGIVPVQTRTAQRGPVISGRAPARQFCGGGARGRRSLKCDPSTLACDLTPERCLVAPVDAHSRRGCRPATGSGPGRGSFGRFGRSLGHRQSCQNPAAERVPVMSREQPLVRRTGEIDSQTSSGLNRKVRGRWEMSGRMVAWKAATEGDHERIRSLDICYGPQAVSDGPDRRAMDDTAGAAATPGGAEGWSVALPGSTAAAG